MVSKGSDAKIIVHSICIHSIIVCNRIVIEGASWGPPQIIYSNFHTKWCNFNNSNTNGYICLDIMPQQEGRI